MRKIALSVVALAFARPAMAEESLRLVFKTYAVGLHIADAEAVLGLGPWGYRLSLSFRTGGLASVVFAGHSASAVDGTSVVSNAGARITVFT